MKKSRNIILKTVLLLFLIMNVVAFFHAYKFTHFKDERVAKSKVPQKFSQIDKMKTLLLGFDYPKPKGTQLPQQKFETVQLQSNKLLETWFINTENSKGTVVLFHGYGAEKASMLDKSDEFIKMGYNTVLVDFMGSGNSEGNQTTIGFKEAENVKTTFDYLQQKGEDNIYLFGTSMGAVAIMKCLNDYPIQPKGIIIECPFGTMYETVCNRFDRMGVPSFPMAGVLLFWGGVQNGFWGFGHNPSEYAKNINCPTLLLYGETDKNVLRTEIDEIYLNLKGNKTLKVYPKTGHENYLIKNKTEWVKDIDAFFHQNDT
ncbi:MAG: alpha/beta hydrolase [Flavobacteriales bacterium]|nr:MAG: alpha/beta hydrolase [Flavobacteriales bacterium]